MVIPGIEAIYQRIADAMTATISEGWSAAEFHALFYPSGSIYEAEYIQQTDGRAVSFQPASDGGRAIRELRKMFLQAGQPVWGEVLFILRADGTFNVQWGYDGCDVNGDLLFDEEAEARRHEKRRIRLLDGIPREADLESGSGCYERE